MNQLNNKQFPQYSDLLSNNYFVTVNFAYQFGMNTYVKSQKLNYCHRRAKSNGQLYQKPQVIARNCSLQSFKKINYSSNPFNFSQYQTPILPFNQGYKYPHQLTRRVFNSQSTDHTSLFYNQKLYKPSSNKQTTTNLKINTPQGIIEIKLNINIDRNGRVLTSAQPVNINKQVDLIKQNKESIKKGSQCTNEYVESNIRQQESIYCVICKKDYKYSQKDEHIELHKKKYQKVQSSKGSKQNEKTHLKFINKTKLQTKPIVQPQQHNIYLTQRNIRSVNRNSKIHQTIKKQTTSLGNNQKESLQNSVKTSSFNQLQNQQTNKISKTILSDNVRQQDALITSFVQGSSRISNTVKDRKQLEQQSQNYFTSQNFEQSHANNQSYHHNQDETYLIENQQPSFGKQFNNNKNYFHDQNSTSSIKIHQFTKNAQYYSISNNTLKLNQTGIKGNDDLLLNSKVTNSQNKRLQSKDKNNQKKKKRIPRNTLYSIL